MTVDGLGHIPPYVGNGVIGLRPGSARPGEGSAIVSGFVRVDPLDLVEAWAYAPYPFDLDLRTGGWWMSQHPEAVRLVGQRLDLSTGELSTTHAIATPAGDLQLETLLFASRQIPVVAAQRVRLASPHAIAIELVMGIDASRGEGRCLRQDGAGWGRSGTRVQAALLWGDPDARSRIGMAFALAGPARPEVKPDGLQRSGPHACLQLQVGPAAGCEVTQITAMVPDLMHADPDRQAIRMAYLAADRGFAHLRSGNAEAWAELWPARPVIACDDPGIQRMADADFYHLHSSLHRSSPAATGLFGLGQYPGYHCFRGHVFWDIDSFVLPAVLPGAPDSAAAVLEFRFRGLEAARANARMHGLPGAMFPWEASPTRGEESTPCGYPHIIHEQHISIDIALAALRFARHAADSRWIGERGMPLLAGICEWIAARAVCEDGAWHIRGITGINEEVEPVDDNAWVNTGAALALAGTAELFSAHGRMADPRWKAIASGLHLPRNRNGDVVLSRGVRTPDHAQSEAAMAFFPMEWPDRILERATLRSFLADVDADIGYPMMPPFFPVHAARAGDPDLATELVRRCWTDYHFGPWLMADEFGITRTEGFKPRVGPYLAHCAAAQIGLVYGFTGLSPGFDEPHCWARRAPSLPTGWRSITCERIWIRGRPCKLTARAGEMRAQLRALDQAQATA